jgi:DNA polymerase (family 10)
MESGHIKILGHPTGQKIKSRNPCLINMEEIFEASKRTKTFLEINAMPERLDLNELHARAAKDAGGKLVINSDAHNKEHLKYMRIGIATARRGWIEKEDILNTLPLKRIMKLLKI